MQYDNCVRFVQLTQREIAVGTVRRSGIVFDPGLLLIMAIKSKALLIAKAILDGSAGLGISDLNEGMNPFYPPPAFVAARAFLPDMINELDCYGARFDILCQYHPSYYLMVPFEAAIIELGDKISWSLAQSFDVLIHSLYDNLNLELETISLLMGKVPVDRIKKVIFEYAGRLNVVGLTVLLYVDSVSEHLGLLKEFSAEVYSSLVNTAGEMELDYDVIDNEQEALDAVKRSVEFFRTGNFEVFNRKLGCLHQQIIL